MAKATIVSREDVDAAFVAATKKWRFTTIKSGRHKAALITAASQGKYHRHTFAVLANDKIAIVPKIDRVVGIGPFCPYDIHQQEEVIGALERLGAISTSDAVAYFKKSGAYEDDREARDFGRDLAKAALKFGFKITAEQRRKLSIKA